MSQVDAVSKSFYRLVRERAGKKLRDDRVKTFITIVAVGLVFFGATYLDPQKTHELLVRFYFSAGAAILAFAFTYIWKHFVAASEIYSEVSETRDAIREELDRLNERIPEIVLSEHPPAYPFTVDRSQTEVSLGHMMPPVKLNHATVLLATPFGPMDDRTFQEEFVMHVSNHGQETAENIEIDFPRTGGLKVTFEVPPLQPTKGWPLMSHHADYRDGVSQYRVNNFGEFLSECDRRAFLTDETEDLLHLAGSGQRVFPLSIKYTSRRGIRYIDYYHLVYYRSDQKRRRYKLIPDGHEMVAPDGRVMGPPASRTPPPAFPTLSVREASLKMELEPGSAPTGAPPADADKI
jgi:hypothetical protein